MAGTSTFPLDSSSCPSTISIEVGTHVSLVHCQVQPTFWAGLWPCLGKCDLWSFILYMQESLEGVRAKMNGPRVIQNGVGEFKKQWDANRKKTESHKLNTIDSKNKHNTQNTLISLFSSSPRQSSIGELETLIPLLNGP